MSKPLRFFIPKKKGGNLKIKITTNRLSAIIIPLFILLSCIVMIFTGLNLSSDVAITNPHICRAFIDECIPIPDSIILSDEFEEIQVCADYQSSKRNSLEVFLLYETGGPKIGLLIDRTLGPGKFQVCYSLKDIVESLGKTNLSDKNRSPIFDGVIEPGIYRIVFERGRVKLDEMFFKVLPSE